MMWDSTDYIILIIFIALAISGVYGYLSYSIANKRGYSEHWGYFWLGFFLWIAGLLYVVGLPIKDKASQPEEKDETETELFSESHTQLQPQLHPASAKWQHGDYPAGIVTLRLTYMGGYSKEFKNRVHKLLQQGFNKEALYSACVDDTMRQWITSAIEEQ